MNTFNTNLTRFLYLVAGMTLLFFAADLLFKITLLVTGIFLLIRGFTYGRGGFSSILHSVQSRFFNRF